MQSSSGQQPFAAYLYMKQDGCDSAFKHLREGEGAVMRIGGIVQ